MTNEISLPLGRTMRDVLHCFWLPSIADEIRQQRHERDASILCQLRNANIGVNLQVTYSIYHRHPFRTDVSDLARVLLERGIAIRIAIRIKRQPDFVIRRFST